MQEEQRHGITSIWGTLDPFVEPGPIIGRKVANLGFLQALLTAHPFAEYHFFLADFDAGITLRQWVDRACPAVRQAVRIFPRTELPQALATNRYHCFHLSDCLTHQGWLAAVRNKVAPACFPITGVTHSLSYARFGAAFAQHVWPGTTARDCIVATSAAGEQVVRAELAGLRDAMPQGQVPTVARVPLGIWCQEFECPPDRLLVDRLDPQALVFLVPGRISPYSKMDILPLLRAFQRLAQGGTALVGVCLVLAGGTQESAGLPGTLIALAANIGLRLVVFPCPDDQTKKALLHRADVVVSLADNPQETFGLTVLEAQAAGKPVLVSDYDGYRDLVLHEESGFLIPTVDGGCDDGLSLMAPLLYDTTYHLWLAQDVAVDVGAVTQALAALMDSGRRQGMGSAARRHARGFDWSQVLGRYRELWDELWMRAVPQDVPWRHPLALRYDALFAGYPTARLQDQDFLRCTELGRAVARKRDFPIVYAGVEDRISLDLLPAILVWARNGLSWRDLQERVEPQERARLRATVLWMLKGDMLECGLAQDRGDFLWRRCPSRG